ncbi:MAG TPA: response regulator [Abditibacteriaceae bacterium]|jgi:signal transduction histidine kinase
MKEAVPAGDTSNLLTPGAILLVEDTMTMRLLLADQIEQMGHEVITARHGKEALELLEKREFDLVLLDITMPEMDGFAVLKILKDDARWQHLPVLMISGLDEQEAVIRCIAMGADDFLHKPCDPILLRARVGACLEKKRFHDQREEMLHQLRCNNEELRKFEELRDSLTNMIVHDLRAPLTAIITGLEMIEFLPGISPDQRDELIAMAHQGGKTLMGMINDLLDISKMEAGEIQLQCGPVRVGELVEISVHQIKTLLLDRNLQFEQSIAEDLPILWCDASKISRVIVNLLGNAIKFTPTGGQISLTTQLIGDSVQFSISDTGEGIPREAFGRIFEKFGQVESRQSGRKMSTGLGLTFCKMTVEAHGGQIWLDSQIGQGSTFYFTVPVQVK